MRRPLHSALSWLRVVVDGELFELAASLAYSTLLALVPLATVIFSVLAMFPVFDEWARVAETFIFDNFVPASGEVVRNYLQSFSAQVGKLTVIGLVTLLATALLLLATIENALNRIWGVKPGRSTGHRIMIYWTLLTLGPIMIIASLTITSYLISVALLGGNRTAASGFEVFIPALPFLLELSAFTVMYYLVPNFTTRFRSALVGALVAAVLFEIAKIGFTGYVSEFNSYRVIYGALGVIPVFLIWIYISWLVILVGGRYAARLDHMTAESRPVED